MKGHKTESTKANQRRLAKQGAVGYIRKTGCHARMFFYRRCTVLPETSFFTTLHPYRTLNRCRKVVNVVLFFDFTRFLQQKIKLRCKNNSTSGILQHGTHETGSADFGKGAML